MNHDNGSILASPPGDELQTPSAMTPKAVAPDDESATTACLDGEDQTRRRPVSRRRMPPRFLFRDGKLLIRSSRNIVVLKGWPTLLAARKMFFEPPLVWQRFRPHVDLSRQSLSTAKEHRSKIRFADYERKVPDAPKASLEPCAAFFAMIPRDVVRAIEQFQERQWHFHDSGRQR